MFRISSYSLSSIHSQVLSQKDEIFKNFDEIFKNLMKIYTLESLKYK